MQSFRQLDRHFGLVPAQILNLVSAIDQGKGRQDAFRRQHPATLRTLTQIARIQSTEASNAIEDIVAPRRRIEAIVAEKTMPANRPEEEIAGYRSVLDLVHASAPNIPFTVSVVRQFHRDLYQYTPVRAGGFKVSDNTVTETHPDGRIEVRFRPVGVFETPGAMDELHERFSVAWAERRFHPLLLVAAYVFDFTVIHPFQDGNGRMSRLLTLLLLYHSGYDVGRFISLERLISESRESYYDALRSSTEAWHRGEHDLQPWLGYFLGVVALAHRLFEERVGAVSGRGSKRAAIEQFVRASVPDEFTIDQVRRAAAGVSDSYISRVLAALKQDGVVEPLSTGRSARWRKLRDDF